MLCFFENRGLIVFSSSLGDDEGYGEGEGETSYVRDIGRVRILEMEGGEVGRGREFSLESKNIVRVRENVLLPRERWNVGKECGPLDPG